MHLHLFFLIVFDVDFQFGDAGQLPAEGFHLVFEFFAHFDYVFLQVFLAGFDVLDHVTVFGGEVVR